MSEDALIRLSNLRSLGLTAKELSILVGGKESYWFGMLAGKRSFGEKIARKIEEAKGLQRGALDSSHATALLQSPQSTFRGSASNQAVSRIEGAQAAITLIDLENNPDYPAIRRVAIKAQAGVSGYAVEYMNDDGPPIVFRSDWYKAKGYRPDKMLALRVCGESMIPSLYEGDLIVINTEQAQPKQGLPFLVSYEGEVVVKRLVRDDGLWWLTSDNPDQRRYPRTKCNGGTQIIGEVVYRQTERI